MLVIRLSRVGRKKLAMYRIVAADSRRSATGKIVAQLGHYNPHTKAIVIKKEQLEAYLKNGAQPSSAIVKLLKKEKVKLPKWAEGNLVVKKKAPKKTEKKTEETAKPAQKTESQETSSEEQPPEETAPEKAEAEAEKPAAKAEGPPPDAKSADQAKPTEAKAEQPAEPADTKEAAKPDEKAPASDS